MVDGDTKPTPNLLPLLRSAVAAMLERADLEHIRVVPALAQRRVRENEAHRIVEAQQQLLILQNQLIRRDIVALVAAALEAAVYLASLLVDAEVARMRLGGIGATLFQVADIGRVKHSDVVVQHGDIFLLEHLAVLRVDLIALLVIPAILCHLVDKEQ